MYNVNLLNGKFLDMNIFICKLKYEMVVKF